MDRSLVRIVFVVVLLVPALAGCAGPAEQPPDVLATFYPLEFLAARIGGTDVSIASLVPSGVEPHEYEPTTGDLVRLGSAKLLVVQGAGFEGWIEQARAQAGATRIAVATEGLDVGDDPHAWLDPRLFGEMATNVERAMAAAFPAHAAAFAGRAETLRADLAALDREMETGLATCETRFIITSHDAFGHLASRYNFTQRGITGLSPDAEPDPRTVQELVEEARAHNVTVVFFEELVSPRVAQIIAEEIGGTTRILSPVEGVADEDRAKGVDYLTLMRANLAALREAMRCT